MRVALTTRLAAAPERVWAEVQTSRLLEYVAAPLVRFRALNPAELPLAGWIRATKYRC